MKSPKAGIVMKKNPLYDNFYSASSKLNRETHHDVMSVMMADVMVKVSMVKMERKNWSSNESCWETRPQNRSFKEQMQTRETAKNVVQENKPQQQSNFVSSLSVQ